VKSRKKIEEPVFLEGKAFTRLGLLDHCSELQVHPGTAPWRKDVLAFIARFLDPGNPDIPQLSSGTTGDPKSHILSRDAMINSACRTIEFFGLSRGDRALLCLPVHYIAGKMMVVRALAGGLDLLLEEPSSRPIRDLEEGVDFTAMVPLQIEESLRNGDPFARISRLLIGGGELHPSTRNQLSSMTVPEVYESFGMTETYTHFALKRINGPEADPVFRLLKDVHISTDQRGCLQVEVPGITSGTVLTNDLVEITVQGDGFTWQGRFDNLINTGGVKIIPELLEDRIRECLGKECLVLPEADRKMGNRLVLLVEFQGEEAPVEFWKKLLKNMLSPYEMPRRILTVQSLPRNPSMKPDRTSAMDLLL
jgi:O-succinylbenzoic acid--CoA ligase